jgi:hypothetical protein
MDGAQYGSALKLFVDLHQRVSFFQLGVWSIRFGFKYFISFSLSYLFHVLPIAGRRARAPAAAVSVREEGRGHALHVSVRHVGHGRVWRR